MEYMGWKRDDLWEHPNSLNRRRASLFAMFDKSAIVSDVALSSRSRIPCDPLERGGTRRCLALNSEFWSMAFCVILCRLAGVKSSLQSAIIYPCVRLGLCTGVKHDCEQKNFRHIVFRIYFRSFEGRSCTSEEERRNSEMRWDGKHIRLEGPKSISSLREVR